MSMRGSPSSAASRYGEEGGTSTRQRQGNIMAGAGLGGLRGGVP